MSVSLVVVVELCNEITRKKFALHTNAYAAMALKITKSVYKKEINTTHIYTCQHTYIFINTNVCYVYFSRFFSWYSLLLCLFEGSGASPHICFTSPSPLHTIFSRSPTLSYIHTYIVHVVRTLYAIFNPLQSHQHHTAHARHRFQRTFFVSSEFSLRRRRLHGLHRCYAPSPSSPFLIKKRFSARNTRISVYASIS